MALIHLSWKRTVDVFADATTASSTVYRVPNSDGLTSTVITGSGFTYDGEGFATAGAISKIELVVNSDQTILQRVTNLAVGLADIGGFARDVASLRDQIGWFGVIDQGDNSIVLFEPTRILQLNTDGTYTEALGSGFAQAVGGALSGTVTSLRHLAADQTTVLPGALSGISVSLTVGASALSNTLASSSMYMLAGQGNNTFQGFTAIVTGTNYAYTNFDSTAGNDAITGEPPGPVKPDYISHVDYSTASAAVQVDLATGIVTGGAGADSLVNIFAATGSDLDDTLTGNSNINTLYGSLGNDTLNGAEDSDTLIGGLGDDSLNGGSGTDWAEYFGFGTDSVTGVTVSLAIAGAQNTVGQGIDTLVSIENLSGSLLADSLTGSGSENSILGHLGNDTLSGGTGNDTLDGGAGVDQMLGGDNEDTIIWDPLDDLANVLGGNGTDTLRVVNQAAPTSFNLATHQFENANVVTDDPGGNWWLQISDYYNASWQRTNSDTRADNGNLVQTTYDVSAGGTAVNWQYISDYRNASGVLTNQDGKFDNDGTFSKSYDYAAGTGTDGISDELAEFTYFFRNVTDQQNGLVLNVEGFYDDGRKFTQTNDIDANQAWQFQTNWYETDGVTLDFLEIRWDNGSTQIIPY